MDHSSLITFKVAVLIFYYIRRQGMTPFRFYYIVYYVAPSIGACIRLVHVKLEKFIAILNCQNGWMKLIMTFTDELVVLEP